MHFRPGSLATLVEQVLKEKLDAAKNVTSTPKRPPAKNATVAEEEPETAAAGDFRPKPRPSGDLKRPKEPFTSRKARKGTLAVELTGPEVGERHVGRPSRGLAS